MDPFKKPIIRYRRFSRREMLGILGSATAALVTFGRDRSEVNAAAAALPACVVRPEQTEGPFFIDEQSNRSDIRSGPSDGSAGQGTLLHLQFQVSRIDGKSCSRIDGAIVDVWHCNALGVYSAIDGESSRKFLRGYQITNAKGIADFLTIYPGWYEGRCVHIHFKIRGKSAARLPYEFTSQLYFEDSVTDEVHRSAPYNSRGRRAVTNENDFLFRNGGKQLMPKLSKSRQGYEATFDIGLRLA